MSAVNHFACMMPVKPWDGDPGRRADASSGGEVPPDGPAEIRLLQGLRGKEIRLLLSGHTLAGKLMQLDPITLVGADGSVTVVPPGRIQAIQF